MYYFIINPASGSGKGLAVWRILREELNRQGVPYRAHLLRSKKDALALAAGFCRVSRPATLVVVGGDGTINDVLSGLPSYRNITFACIPTGSGNDFVRGLQLEKDPLKALGILLHPEKTVEINVGAVRTGTGPRRKEYVFAVSSGLGFDAAVCHSIRKSKLKAVLNRFRAGKLAYLITALYLVATMKRHTIEISLDDGPFSFFEKAYFAALMNLPYEGGGFRFCPKAQPGDDHLDLIAAYGISRLRVLYLLPMALSGRHVGHQGVEILRCQKAVLRSDVPLHLHTDGETPAICREAEFSLKKEKLAVIVR